MNFTIYSKQGCPYCDKIKYILNHISNENGFKVSVFELGKDFNREEFYEKFGDGSTFPQVILNEQNIGGCSDTIKYLQESNII